MEPWNEYLAEDRRRELRADGERIRRARRHRHGLRLWPGRRS
jgi:hypothetical protein